MPLFQRIELGQLVMQLGTAFLQLLGVALATAELLTQFRNLLLQRCQRLLILVPALFQLLQSFTIGIVARPVFVRFRAPA